MSLWSRLERRLGDLAGELVLDEAREQLQQARELIAKRELPQAIEILRALVATRPEHGQALMLLGDAELEAGEAAAAAATFARALEQRPGDPIALLGSGLALTAQGRYEPAIAALGRAVSEAGGNRGLLADAYRGLGVAWRRRGELDKAIRELRKAVAEDAEDLDARAALGEALVADGNSLDEARRHLERAGVVPEPPALALYGLGRLALGDDLPGLAGDLFTRARTFADLDTTPLGNAIRYDILVGLGDVALALRDAPRAHGFFLEALAVDARRAEIHARIAAAHRIIGNSEAALTSYDLALARGADLSVLRAAVDAAIAAGDVARELTWGNDLLAREPDNVRALVARGSAIAHTQPDAARVLLEIAAVRDDVDAHLQLARLALATEPARAASSVLAALRVAPHDARARRVLTEARERLLAPPAGDDIAELARNLEQIVASRRELGHQVGEIARAAAALDAPLLVTVMGEFSSGKSSFVNAFIGADVAPTGITPTTATINVLRYGRERGGRVVFTDPAADTLELGWDALMGHLRALTQDAARAIDRVEILVPLPQLEKINIVDTPGLNSIQPEHEATARAFIARADAVVWVFTASQGGKASERAALQSIRDEGKRVLGVLNKADTLSAADIAEVVTFIGGSLGELVETIVPFSARRALAWKRAGNPASRDDGDWQTLAAALEERFFTQARQLKRDACARVLRGTIGEAQGTLEIARRAATAAAESARAAAAELTDSAHEFAADAVVAERKALSEVTTALYRRASREVLDLVRPRRLPFSSHSATPADRDYLIALLSSGFEAAIESGRARVAADLVARSRGGDAAARALAAALDRDVVGDLQRTADDRIGLALSRVFDRTRAYLRGYLEGGYVEAFFRNDVPRLELSEDAVYHALFRAAPDLDRELGAPLARAATEALSALAARLEHWAAVVDVQTFDLEVGVVRALDQIAARL